MEGIFTSAEKQSKKGKSGVILQSIRTNLKSRTMGSLQIALRALRESNIFLQMWDQNNEGHRKKNLRARRGWMIQEENITVQHRTETLLLATLLSSLPIPY